MNRLWNRNAPPKPTPKEKLDGAITGVDNRLSSIDVKLASLNAELSTYQQRLARMRHLPDSSPTKAALRQKALRILNQRRQYETQREQLQQQSWNMEQAGMMQDNLSNALVTVEAMKSTTKQLKKQYGRGGDLVAKVEKAQDELAEVMDVGEEIMEGLGRGAWDVPEGVNEEDLDAELDALGEEGLGMGMGMGVGDGADAVGAGGVPGFMVDEAGAGAGGVPAFVDDVPEDGKAKEVPAG